MKLLEIVPRPPKSLWTVLLASLPLLYFYPSTLSLGQTELQLYQQGEKGDAFRDIAKDLRCPTCTGLSVLESEAKFSVQIKDIVREKMEAGKDRQEILDFFVERYGPWILRSPPKKGFNILAWAFPIAIMLSGPPLIWFFVWRKRKVIQAYGVRSNDSIIEEMHGRITQLKEGKA
jgi:cytochrome c-type biogenesis protein CcmH/NrfF